VQIQPKTVRYRVREKFERSVGHTGLFVLKYLLHAGAPVYSRSAGDFGKGKSVEAVNAPVFVDVYHHLSCPQRR
jgi:hypothetical protein